MCSAPESGVEPEICTHDGDRAGCLEPPPHLSELKAPASPARDHRAAQMPCRLTGTRPPGRENLWGVTERGVVADGAGCRRQFVLKSASWPREGGCILAGMLSVGPASLSVLDLAP